jgi:ABC-type multidrug transport system fused ATPase/permease subunit
LLTVRERVQVVLLAGAMGLNGMLQSFSLAALLPVIALIVDPAATHGWGSVAMLSRWLGEPDPRRLLIWCSVAVLVAIVVKNGFHLAYTYWLNRLVTGVERRTAVTLLEQCMSAPYVWFLSRNSVVLLKQVMGDVVTWARSGLKGIMTLLSGAATVMSIVALLVGINPVLGMSLAAGAALLTLGVMTILRPSLRRMAVKKHVASTRAYISVHHALTGVKEIKAAGCERFFIEDFAGHYRVFALNAARPATLQAIPGYIVEIAAALLIVGIGMHAAAHSGFGANVVAILAVYGVAAIRLLPVLNELSGTITSVQAAVPAIEEIEQVRADLEAAQTPRPPVVEPLGWWDSIELRNVVYRYPGARSNALDGATLVVERGARVGIVGRSGSGKTTLVDVLTGLLECTSGRILVAGRELSTVNVNAWRQQIGYVSQHPFIADESLRFNVALGVAPDQVDDARVIRALDRAAFGAVLRDELQGGLDTELGERGTRLSGGQRQRVAIARALYRGARLLILDEATSALDSESERAVSVALGELDRETTVVIVAHRLSTVKECDTIVVLEKGRIVACGGHADLLRECALYRRFVELGDLSLAGTDADDDASPASVRVR